MNLIINVLCAVCGAIAALVTYILIRRILLKGQKEEIIKKAEIEAEKIKNDKIFQAKEKFLQLKSEHEQFINEKNSQIQQIENKIKQKEIVINQQNSELTKKQKGSKAFNKTKQRIAKVHSRVANKRMDYLHKITHRLTHENQVGTICVEDLNVKGMVKNHRLAQSVSDVAFGELLRQIEYKSAYNGVTVKKADRFYPSSKTCSVCGNVKHDLKLKNRTYRCDKCGSVIDRDYNASLNLLSLLSNTKIGSSSPEFTPADLTALLSRFRRNRITTSKIETGRQRKL